MATPLGKARAFFDGAGRPITGTGAYAYDMTPGAVPGIFLGAAEATRKLTRRGDPYRVFIALPPELFARLNDLDEA